MELFSIRCVTCKTRLRVRSLDAIGQILGCPKCGGMVQVEPPEGWQPPDPSTVEPVEHAASSAAASHTPAVPWTSDSQAFRRDIADAAVDGAPRSFSGSLPSDSLVGGPEMTVPATRVASVWPGWLPWACVPLAGIASSALVWWWMGSGRVDSTETLLALDAVQTVAVASPVGPPSEPPAPLPLTAERLARRWLPTETVAVVSLRSDALAEHAAAQTLLHRAAPLWGPAVIPMYAALQLKAPQVRRLTWAATQLGSGEAWQLDHVVGTIELAQPPADVKRWLSSFEKLPGEPPCYRAAAGEWRQPFMLVDGTTIVTGALDRLRELNRRSADDAVTLSNSALDQLLTSLDAARPVLLTADLTAVREAQPPDWVFPAELWGVRREDWAIVRDLPRAAALSWQMTSDWTLELAVECATESDAQQVQGAADSLLAGFEQTLRAERAKLADNLLSLPLSTATADQIDLLLDAGSSALAGRQAEVRQTRVALRANVRGDLPRLAVAALTSVPALEQSRLASARHTDEENQRRLFAALDGHRAQEQTFPAGAAGAALLPPETRLSWFATLLPHYGHFDWHRELKFGRSWNDAENQNITRRALEVAVNPALGLSATPAGFPVTHYVGVAGLGADAGRLEASDPRAGVFGYGRRVKLAAIGDGASNTIALAGVSGGLGPWAAGGSATVRSFTARPYIEGPDGFGSGQPQGLLVGLADGSSRWISRDVDPEVLEALVTINGGESFDQRARERLGWLPAAAPRAVQPAVEAPVIAKATVVAPPAVPATPPGPRIDVTARLNDKIPAINFPQVPLGQFVDFLSQLSTLPITLDLEALLEAGVHPEDKIAVNLTDITVGQVLEQVLSQRGLMYVVHEGQVLVTNPRRRAQTLETVRYDVADLLAGQPRELVAIMSQFVEPSSWIAVGGHGHAKLEGSALVVQQSAPLQHQVLGLLEKLRLARGLPTKTPANALRYGLATRAALARPKLQTAVTANFREPTSLSRILDYLQTAAGVQLPLDGASLVAAGRTAQADATLVVDQRPLAEALDALLEPLGLAYQPLDERTVQITSRPRMAERMELEFYRLDDLIRADEPATAWIERIRSQVAPRSWNDLTGPGALAFDAASKCLLVWQSSAVQRQVEELLDSHRKR